jgi:hypothetical protein
MIRSIFIIIAINKLYIVGGALYVCFGIHAYIYIYITNYECKYDSTT